MSRPAFHTSPVRRLLEAAIDAGFMSAAAAAVVDKEGAVDRVIVGHRFAVKDGADDHSVIDADSAFDLASLTKLLCTTVCVADAVTDGDLALNEEPFPRWPGATVERLLAHCGGLVAHQTYFEAAIVKGLAALPAGKDAITDAVFGTPPESTAGTRTTYSDLGFIALGALLEERTEEPLDALLAAAWTKRARAAGRAPPGLRFVRLWEDGFHPAVPNVVATERCPWRKRALHGQVHDDNCFAMGGVSGHAGLFGSLNDVAAAAALLLPELSDGAQTLAQFARARPDGLGRGLGFDTATAGGATGDVLGAGSVGHVGFTGTSLWFDVDAGAAYVLLMNTVHPSRDEVRVRNLALRRAFHQAAVTGEVDVNAALVAARGGR